MSNTSELNNIILSLSQYLAIYVSTPIGILGLAGNIFSILIFTRPSLVKNPCSIYLLSSAIANLGFIIFGIMAHFLSQGFGIDPSTYNLAYCRIRYFILNISLFLSIWFVTLAGIDRYCVSSRNIRRRQLSNVKYARYIVVLTTLFFLVLYCHELVFFTIEQLSTGPFCYAQSGTYRIFHDFLYFVVYCLIPPIIMIIVGFGIVYNIHQARGQIHPLTTNNMNTNQLRKNNRQLVKMLLIQFIVTVSLILPLAIDKLYSTCTQNVIKSLYRLTIENFIQQILQLFININGSISFFVFTLSGSVYRKEMGRIIGKIISFLFGTNSSIHQKFQRFIHITPNIQLITMKQTTI
ncbi:unnamed protein product [Adineta steineri]|uniref:G-protein coupled receptors family 1 profile domain-containing protein n=1 Tax=Adineta steineri TaxID=433720 RepID=A0A813VXQ8_9BILA|nr:unnamed protein product [Adineta steineri]CAF1407979.1 unnamed protein product [Adineta steineri]